MLGVSLLTLIKRHTIKNRICQKNIGAKRNVTHLLFWFYDTKKQSYGSKNEKRFYQDNDPATERHLDLPPNFSVKSPQKSHSESQDKHKNKLHVSIYSLQSVSKLCHTITLILYDFTQAKPKPKPTRAITTPKELATAFGPQPIITCPGPAQDLTH